MFRYLKSQYKLENYLNHKGGIYLLSLFSDYSYAIYNKWLMVNDLYLNSALLSPQGPQRALHYITISAAAAL